ncbi:MAG: exodeoxyribonuclease III [Ferrimicrobium sp.]
MRLATWNVNSLRARASACGDWLDRYRPDVVCLQETKVTDEQFPTSLFSERDYEVARWGVSAWNGVAIASRIGLGDVSLGLEGGLEEEARAVWAKCGEWRVASVYVPNGRALDDPHYAYKLSWLERLAQTASEFVGDSLVIAGDFNVAPRDLDVWDPVAMEGATHVSEPERSGVAQLEALGLTDCFSSLYPDEQAFTWWDYRQGAFRRNLGMRIDLVFASASARRRCQSVSVDRETRGSVRPSDHAPVIVEFSDEGDDGTL